MPACVVDIDLYHFGDKRGIYISYCIKMAPFSSVRYTLFPWLNVVYFPSVPTEPRDELKVSNKKFGLKCTQQIWGDEKGINDIKFNLGVRRG